MSKTTTQYDSVVKQCKDIFIKKMLDYGSAWRVMRNPSIVDQIFIKTQRIRTIDDKGTQKIKEDIGSDYIGIVNYSLIGLMQLELELAGDTRQDISVEEAGKLFDKFALQAKSLMENKNHDYGEAWRDLRLGSFADLILQKILRMRQIDDHKGKTLISEGVDANYHDMINYAIFALIKIEEKENQAA